ncbi:hypothetical protein COOONC_15501 [Cooperia oncophora]
MVCTTFSEKSQKIIFSSSISLMGKTEVTYETVFSTIRGAVTRATRLGSSVVLDSERASISTAKRVFPNASVEGCAFHLAQASGRRRGSN